VVWAPDRDRARGRMLRALRETAIGGVATTLPAHRVILEHPDFIAARQSANWVDTELDLSIVDDVAGAVPSGGAPAPPASSGAKSAAWRSRRGVPSISTWSPGNGAQAATARREPAARHTRGEILAPMQGTIVRMLVGVGDRVLETDGICVIEAMKMENVVPAGLAGAVTQIRVSPGEPLDSGDLIAVIRE